MVLFCLFFKIHIVLVYIVVLNFVFVFLFLFNIKKKQIRMKVNNNNNNNVNEKAFHYCLTSELVRKRAKMLKRYPVKALLTNITKLDFHRQVCTNNRCNIILHSLII